MAKKAAPKAPVKNTGPKATAAPKAARGPKAVEPRNEASPPQEAADPSPGITIRMYCQGLGDCFLLTYRADAKAKPVRVMIDCGVFLNTPGEADRMKAVADHIFEETRGEIDLLIVTHEHWDHIAGFSHANEVFANEFKFGAVWLSWAENLDDPDSRAIKADLGKKKAQLKAALGLAREWMGMAGAAGAKPLQDDVDSSEGLLGFFGPQPAGIAAGLAAAAPAGGSRMDLGTTMNWLRKQVLTKDFCSPGQRREVPGTDGIFAYILGPPRGASQLRKMNPTGDQGYALAGDASKSSRVSLLGAVSWELSGRGATGEMPPGPFDGRFRVELDEAPNDPFFRRHYGFPGDPMADAVAEWRRIDHDWLVGGLSRLALQLDVGVNNTSLALAFELPDGRTLIFPGDAQIGNWLSWGSLTFKATDKRGRDVEVTSKDLLNRAVFYKVGHHGSHNATMKAGGLEEMTSGDLVAMIPTDRDFARTKRPPKTGWEMPAHGVQEALRGFTGGRIIRADLASKEQLDDEIEDEQVRHSRGWKEFLDRVRFGGAFPAQARKKDGAPLFIEYTISL
jgi:hypothetical protein